MTSIMLVYKRNPPPSTDPKRIGERTASSETSFPFLNMGIHDCAKTTPDLFRPFS